MEPETLSQEAQDAIHKQKNAAQAIESAREVQLAKAVEETALRTKEALLEGLKEVFGDSDALNGEMKILVRRIPLICQDVKQIHSDISDIRDNIKWGVRVAIGALISLGIGGIITLNF